LQFLPGFRGVPHANAICVGTEQPPFPHFVQIQPRMPTLERC
jgi:hypothetical protein